ncbi:uncharacterized protein LOC8267881 [Ricinus communis]|uniref:Uncharacterized protein n=1 Tax=Ricinus communis TaxID=3988 RepID=B9R8K1_RICCO|nr:uncharacterized protein LOC8267881 [Ricinus communis]EEF52831.1 conserved hypothetical protein [Ricinus communis]|eukprot:XP_002510644.1 uncharacterized protein LOC8267881 [Ricinus communis]
MDSSKASCHARSTSLPSESHPLVACVQDKLRKFRSSEATSLTKLDGLKGLYESVDDLLQIPLAQRAFSHEQNVKSVQDILDGSVRLLDICSTTKEVLSQVKCCLQDLESSLRRNNGCQSRLENEIKKYMVSREKVHKIVEKCLGNLKKLQKCNLAVRDKGPDLEAIVSILREVEGISLATFESFLSSICPPKARAKTACRWSLITKLIQSKHVPYDEDSEKDGNQVEKVDASLIALSKQKFSENIHFIQVQRLQKGLETLNSSIKEVEDGLDSVFRCLIKTRVSILNNLSH